MRRKEPYGMGEDPNRKVKDFIRENGPDFFLQHFKEMRGSLIAKAYR